MTLRAPPHLPPTTILNLAIRQLTPVHVKWELPVPQLQFSAFACHTTAERTQR